MAQIKITLSQIVSDLEAGMVKFQQDDVGFGSIQKKYGMTDKEAKIFFSHPLLKDLKPAEVKFLLVDDTPSNGLEEIKPTEIDKPTIVTQGTKRSAKALDEVDLSAHTEQLPDIEAKQANLETDLSPENSNENSGFLPPIAGTPSQDDTDQGEIEGFELL
jgi:hypothetical protein